MNDTQARRLPPRDHQSGWPLLEQTLTGLWALTSRPVRAALERTGTPPALRGYLESRPEILSAAAVDPYSNPTSVLAELSRLAAAGWLEPAGDAEFRLTERARENVRDAVEAGDAYLETLDLLPPGELALASLLERLATANGRVRLFPLARHRAPDATTSAIRRIRGAVVELSAQRDDAHRAAWLPLGVSGQAWNAFTLIWHGDARNAAEVAALQSWRGYTAADYEVAIADLEQRGWLEPDVIAGRYRLSDEGAALRDEAETRTDHLFYEPWFALADGELVDLLGQLATLHHRLRELRRAEREARPVSS